MFNDFTVLYENGQALWQGRYQSLYPLPMVGLFGLLALAPYRIALGALLAMSLIAFVSTLKRDTLPWIFYVPVLQCFYLGQIDLLFLWCVRHGSALSLALVSLKPQLLPFVVPVLWRDRRKIAPFLAWVAALYLPLTLLFPRWLPAWFAQADDGRLSASTASSFWSVFALWLVALVMLVLLRRLKWRTLFTTFSPFIRAYDYVMLAPYNKIAIPLSWVTLGLSWLVGSAWPYGFLGL